MVRVTEDDTVPLEALEAVEATKTEGATVAVEALEAVDSWRLLRLKVIL